MSLNKVIFMFFITLSVASQQCTSGSSEKKTSNKFRQYYIKGESLYETHCSNCHQKDGVGLGLLFPPLNTSDFMEKNVNEVICLIRYGKNGEIIVNGRSFNKEMPANQSLTDIEIAEIATFIYNSWSHNKGIFEVKEVSDVLKNCVH